MKYIQVFFSSGADYLLDTDGTKFFVEDEITYLGIPEIDTYFENAVVRKTFTINDLNENGDVVLKFAHVDTKGVLITRKLLLSSQSKNNKRW